MIRPSWRGEKKAYAAGLPHQTAATHGRLMPGHRARLALLSVCACLGRHRARPGRRQVMVLRAEVEEKR